MSLSILDQFLKEVQGRKYNMTFDLLRRKKTISEAGLSQYEMAAALINNSAAQQQEQEEIKLVEEGRPFFCSELVVKAYKLCGIMQQTDQACSNFLPAHLSS